MKVEKKNDKNGISNGWGVLLYFEVAGRNSNAVEGSYCCCLCVQLIICINKLLYLFEGIVPGGKIGS